MSAFLIGYMSAQLEKLSSQKKKKKKKTKQNKTKETESQKFAEIDLIFRISSIERLTGSNEFGLTCKNMISVKILKFPEKPLL